MALTVETIQDYTIQKDFLPFWMCFYTPNNDFHVNKTKHSDLFDKDKTDYKARDEFLAFMKENFPKRKLIMVFDTAPVGYLSYPYLGSLAVDCEENDEVYKAINKNFKCVSLEFAMYFLRSFMIFL
ncbi:hypothetical protein UPTC4110_0866 [Campylobacter lari CCUG 22395]|uniref:hypothetical protein n=1 Tax=Campylobacter lari TaxID=201 RepID=UPI000581EAB8|nr:hypothetical protein [Campylobacter lari]AJD03411.1 hypothetical protein UPTC4110_0866 [Campylobacter lari CCUG 22395]MCV3425762.1 hypothetical protein [Campylobacter lari]MCV3457948.1 hypothetical protein [Campylobacter lari]